MVALIQLTDTLYVSAQPGPDDMATLAAEGFNTVVCNRPDGESEGQPTMDELEAEATAAGLRFVRYPVNAMNFPGEDLAGLGATLDGGGKVLAFCRTGTRSANLWVASRPASERVAAAELARSHGIDLSLSQRLV